MHSDSNNGYVDRRPGIEIGVHISQLSRVGVSSALPLHYPQDETRVLSFVYSPCAKDLTGV